MGENSKIEWCDSTWNPWEGCTKVSPACAHCYAEAMNHRWGKDNWGPGKPRRRTSEANWKQPLRWDEKAWRSRVDRSGTIWTEKRRSDEGVVAFSDRVGCCGTLITVEDWDRNKRWRPRVFSASLADWLDDEVPIEWLADFLKLIHDTPNLDWLLLTKRPENWKERIAGVAEHVCDSDHEGREDAAWLADKWRSGNAPENVWMGATVENQEYADKRIPELLKIPAKVRFLSMEPLLGPVDLTAVKQTVAPGYFGDCLQWYHRGHVHVRSNTPYPKIDWVITGGESGPKAQPSHPDWFRSLRDQCQAAGVAYFHKQNGEWLSFDQAAANGYDICNDPRYIARKMDQMFIDNEGPFRLRPGAPDYERNKTRQGVAMNRVGKRAAGRLLDGQEWSQFPEVGR